MEKGRCHNGRQPQGPPYSDCAMIGCFGAGTVTRGPGPGALGLAPVVATAFFHL